ERRKEYVYDGADNVFVGGGQETRSYGPGGRLLRSNDVTYEWDEAGRLGARRRASGAADHYRWKPNGMLGEVARGDLAVAFDYDQLGRRVRKRVMRDDGGGRKLVSDTRFLYDGAELVREIERRAREDGDPIVIERSYVHDEEGHAPLAQRTDSAAGSELVFL